MSKDSKLMLIFHPWNPSFLHGCMQNIIDTSLRIKAPSAFICSNVSINLHALNQEDGRWRKSKAGLELYSMECEASEFFLLEVNEMDMPHIAFLKEDS